MRLHPRVPWSGHGLQDHPIVIGRLTPEVATEAKDWFRPPFAELELAELR